jgi:hypothetical protein
LAGLLQRDLCLRIADLVDDDLLGDDGNFACFWIDLDLNILSLAETLLGGCLQGGFDGPDNPCLVNSLLASDFVDY